MLLYYKSVITGELLVLESSHWYQMKSIRFDGAFAEDQDKKNPDSWFIIVDFLAWRGYAIYRVPSSCYIYIYIYIYCDLYGNIIICYLMWLLLDMHPPWSLYLFCFCTYLYSSDHHRWFAVLVYHIKFNVSYLIWSNTCKSFTLHTSRVNRELGGYMATMGKGKGTGGGGGTWPPWVRDRGIGSWGDTWPPWVRERELGGGGHMATMGKG